MLDTLIIGSGPAGLTAAIYACRAELTFQVLEKEPTSGGQVINTYDVDNYPGLKGIGGFDLAMKFREHAEQLGTSFVNAQATSIEKRDGEDGGYFAVQTNQGEFTARTVILATGASHAKLGVPGEDAFAGRGVSYCATCDGAFFRKKTAVVVGGGDVAAEDALFLSRLCSKVYLIHRRGERRAAPGLATQVRKNEKIEVRWNSVVEEIRGEAKVGSVLLNNLATGEHEELPTDAVFIAVGIVPGSAWLGDFVKINEKGYVVAGEDTAASVPGVFAAGDLRAKRLRQIITACSDGACAATAVQDYLAAQKRGH